MEISVISICIRRRGFVRIAEVWTCSPPLLWLHGKKVSVMPNLWPFLSPQLMLGNKRHKATRKKWQLQWKRMTTTNCQFSGERSSDEQTKRWIVSGSNSITEQWGVAPSITVCLSAGRSHTEWSAGETTQSPKMTPGSFGRNGRVWTFCFNYGRQIYFTHASSQEFVN